VSLILTEYHDYIGTITLNNPEKRNALNRELVDALSEALHDFTEKQARAVVLRARKGARIWCAGLDLSEFPQPGRDPLSYANPAEHALREIQRFPAPVIAMIEGGVWGGGCELACVCDILIGTETSSFCITPAKLGIPYNPSGILHFLNSVGLNIIKEMLFTAEPVDAERAHKLGLLNHLVPVAELEGFTYRMARKITENSPLSISVIKEQLRLLANAMPLNPETFERIQALRRRVYDSQDYIEGQKAFLEKRKPVFRGE
jgi:methylmalonyl-CoA decarboxylase